MNSEYYTRSFYQQLHQGAVQSAEVIVPLVLQLIPAHSVVDLGCGEGAWLAAFRRAGVEHILGVDGDYVDRRAVKIPQQCFRAADLSIPLVLDRTFDLAVSLEVAEHLPPESASVFVDSLTRLAPAVLFSAAIPFQGGANHVNEQWPEVWTELFDARGYAVVDAIRKRVWQDRRVEWWYAQNTLLFVRGEILQQNSLLYTEFQGTNRSQLSLVHPQKYSSLQGEYQQALAREFYMQSHPVSAAEAFARMLYRWLKNSFHNRLDSFRHSNHSHPKGASGAKAERVTF